MASSSAVTLTDAVVSRYSACRVFTATSNVLDSDRSVLLSPVTSFDIEPVEGSLGLASHGRRNAVTLFDLDAGVLIQRFNRVASENGVAQAKFTRRVVDSSCLIVPYVSPSDTLSYAIRTYSLLQSTTLRTFPGHGQQVCSLAQSPVDDVFVSADVGGEVRIWDARLALSCVGRTRLPASADSMNADDTVTVAFHPNGTTLAVMKSSTGTVRLFNLAKLDNGPFAVFQAGSELRLPRPLFAGAQPDPVTYVDFRFSPTGSMLLVTTDRNICFALDPNGGKLLYQCDIVSTQMCQAVPSFSCDGKYFAVNGSGGPMVFRASDGQLVNSLQGGNSCSTSRTCCFSPRSELLVTSGEDATILWCEREA